MNKIIYPKCKNCGKIIHKLKNIRQPYCSVCRTFHSEIPKETIKENFERIDRGEPLTIPLSVLDGYFKNRYIQREQNKSPIVKAKKKAWIKKYRKTARYKASEKKYRNSEKYKAWYEKYRQSPKFKAWRKAYYQKYLQTPKAKALKKARDKRYYDKHRKEILQQEKEHRQIPEIKAKRKAYMRTRYQEIKEKRKIYSRDYYYKHKARLLEKNKIKAREYYKKNRDKVLIKHKKYMKSPKYQAWYKTYEQTSQRKAQRQLFNKKDVVMAIEDKNPQQKTIVICEVCKLKKLYPYEEALKIALAHKKGYHKVI